MDLKTLLSSLRDVAGSPWALIGYIVVVGAWVVRSYVLARPQRRAREILQLYSSDAQRTKALEELMGSSPPRGLQKAQILDWVAIQAKAQNRLFLLIAYVSTLIMGTVIVGLAVYHAQPPEDTSKPVLVKSKAEK
jgi:hypothetical protein